MSKQLRSNIVARSIRTYFLSHCTLTRAQMPAGCEWGAQGRSRLGAWAPSLGPQSAAKEYK